jgi:hypothetical protein
MGHPAVLAASLNSTAHSAGDFVADVCRPFLLQSQNADGGWGFHPGATSAVEPTAWAMLALAKRDPQCHELARAAAWLLGCQNQDGSWPSRPETVEASWITPLGGLALLALKTPETSAAIQGAAEWTCQSHTGQRHWKMLVARFLTRRKVVGQDLSLEGWSWTPGTASWIEPTAVALIFLRQLSGTKDSPNAVARVRMGESFLYDRMCPSGGWSMGNPKIYGIEGIAQAGVTAWALIALQKNLQREENRRSIEWLETNFDSISGASSLALARIALEANGRSTAPIESKLAAQFASDRFLNNTLAVSQAAFALEPGPDVLRWTAAER